MVAVEVCGAAGDDGDGACGENGDGGSESERGAGQVGLVEGGHRTSSLTMGRTASECSWLVLTSAAL